MMGRNSSFFVADPAVLAVIPFRGVATCRRSAVVITTCRPFSTYAGVIDLRVGGVEGGRGFIGVGIVLPSFLRHAYCDCKRDQIEGRRESGVDVHLIIAVVSSLSHCSMCKCEYVNV
mmetsp:Transcript_45708/g.118138  ORF Transcript_45708/g.118138 Transcript_45708/m.118138 type:complete len:117 (-) Transcript_45708:70-420(-)